MKKKWDVADFYLGHNFTYSDKGLELLCFGFKSRSKTAFSKEVVKDIMREFLRELLNEVKQLSSSELDEMYNTFIQENWNNYCAVGDIITSLSKNGELDRLKDYLKMDGDRVLTYGDIYKSPKDCINKIEKILEKLDKLGDENLKMSAALLDDSLKEDESSKNEKKKSQNPSLARFMRSLPISFEDSVSPLKNLFLSNIFCNYVDNEIVDRLESPSLQRNDDGEICLNLYSTKDEVKSFLKEINKLRGSFNISNETFEKLKKGFLQEYTKKVKLAKNAVDLLSEFLKKLDKLKEGDNFSKFFGDYIDKYTEKRFFEAEDYYIRPKREKGKSLQENLREANNKFYKLKSELEEQANISQTEKEKDLKLTSELKEATKELFECEVEKFKVFVEQVSPMLDDLEKLTCEELIKLINNYKIGNFEEEKRN